MKLVLASSSPRRRQLLEEGGYDFKVITPEIDEEIGLCSNCGPAELVVELAQAKAADVVRRIKDQPEYVGAIVVACDTVVECGGHILGKPRNEDHARQILQLLSGQRHRVFSGLCLWQLPDGLPNAEVDVTKLEMDKLKPATLEAYLASGGWQGKAGAFGYQDGLDWVSIIDGSTSNVVGLPMELFGRLLRSVESQSA